MASSSKANPPTTPKFTPEMQDRQARSKDPRTGKGAHTSSPDEEGSSSSPKKRSSVIAAADDAYESGQRRRWAATILNSAELLQLHALARGDSVPSTHQHFTKILCGYDDPPRTSEKRAAAARKEREKKPLSRVNYKPFVGPFEM